MPTASATLEQAAGCRDCMCAGGGRVRQDSGGQVGGGFRRPRQSAVLGLGLIDLRQDTALVLSAQELLDFLGHPIPAQPGNFFVIY